MFESSLEEGLPVLKRPRCISLGVGGRTGTVFLNKRLEVGSWCEAGPPCQFGGPSVCVAAANTISSSAPAPGCGVPTVRLVPLWLRGATDRRHVGSHPGPGGAHCLPTGRGGSSGSLGMAYIAKAVTVHHPDTKDAGRAGIFGRRRMCENKR